jgi:hypothetical protein
VSIKTHARGGGGGGGGNILSSEEERETSVCLVGVSFVGLVRLHRTSEGTGCSPRTLHQHQKKALISPEGINRKPPHKIISGTVFSLLRGTPLARHFSAPRHIKRT